MITAIKKHSHLIRLFNLLINTYNLKRHSVIIGKNHQIDGLLFIRNNGNIQIGSNFIARSGKRVNPIGGDTTCRLIIGKGAKLCIGNNVGISNSTIFCEISVSIGNNTLIGGGCKIWDTDFHSLNPANRAHPHGIDIAKAPIVIRDNVFIGAGSIILKGVSVGHNAVIGAASVVTKSVPDNELWAGNPAIFKRALDISQAVATPKTDPSSSA